MKILVFSDSHRQKFFVKEMISKHHSVDLIVFLGDGEDDVWEIPLEYPQKAFIALKGNCDLGSTASLSRTFSVEGKTFFCTHGHLYHAKSTLLLLQKEALEKNASVVLFGHTHKPLLLEENGITFLNPGSLANGSYALLTLENGQLHAEHFMLD